VHSLNMQLVVRFCYNFVVERKTKLKITVFNCMILNIFVLILKKGGKR
jgi:hypothetical protein